MRIDLQKFRSPKALVLSGRPKGEEIRKVLGLNQEDTQPDKVEIIVPSEVLSINSSFFSGLFGESVRKLGRSRFEEKYEFICEPPIKEQVEQGISEALRRSNPLPQVGKPK